MPSTNPWDLYPDLLPERLADLSSLMIRVRNGAVAEHRPELGDRNWGLGTRSYERTTQMLAQMAEAAPWLKIIDLSLRFVFAVGDTPLRIHRESYGLRCELLRVQPDVAIAKQQDLFSDHHAQRYLRLVLVTGADFLATQVDLVAYGLDYRVQDRWYDIGVATSRRTKVTSILPPPIETAPVEILDIDDVVEEESNAG